MADTSAPAEGSAGAPRHRYDAIPAELKARPQWLVWRNEGRGNKRTKVPYRAIDGRTRASSTDPQTWGTFEQALACPVSVQGIGYVFSPDDPYVGADLDKCIVDGELHSAATELLTALGGHQEISPSKVGMHAIFRGELTGDRHRTSDTPWGGEFEIYDQGRYFTMTGNGSGDVEHQPPLDELMLRMFGRSAPAVKIDTERTAEELVALYPKLGQIIRREVPAPKRDSSQSGWDLKLAGEMVRSDLSQAEFVVLLKHARGKDRKAIRKDYVKGTWRKAQTEVRSEGPPHEWLSYRYNLEGDERIVRGDPLTDVAGGACRVYLYNVTGRQLRLPRLDDLFDPAKHTRIVSRVMRAKFDALTIKEAVSLTQAIIALCGGDDADPLEDARGCVIEFVAHAGARIDMDPDRSRWENFSTMVVEEERLAERYRDPARRSCLLYDPETEELWLPAGALVESSAARMIGSDLKAAMAEIGWRHEDVDLRGPGGRLARVAGEVGRIHRRFYVGKD